MNDSKQIINYCPNFYKIIEFNPINGDELTGKLIKMYQDYIDNISVYNEEEINEIKDFDAALAKYIDDYSFRREVQKQIARFNIKDTNKDLIKLIIKFINKILATYDEYTTRVIYISRWI